MIFPLEYHEDFELSADQLDDKYNPNGNGEHPLITSEDWRTEVADQGTCLGYWDWLEYRLELIQDDGDEKYEVGE